MPIRIKAERVQDFVDGRQAVDVAFTEFDASSNQVDVRIMKAGQQHFSAKIDQSRIRAFPLEGSFIAADIHDPSVTNGHGIGPASNGIHRIDSSVPENRVRWLEGLSDPWRGLMGR